MSDQSWKFEAEVAWTEEKKGLLFLDGKPDLPVATPPEFGGHEGITTPEDLFVASIAVCYLSTFVAMVQKIKAKFVSFSCRAEGLLEAPNKGLEFTRIDVYPEVTVAGEEDVQLMERALDLAARYCLVTNSLKSEIVNHPEIKIQ